MTADSVVSTLFVVCVSVCLGVGVGDTLDQLFVFVTTVGLFCSVTSVPDTFGSYGEIPWVDH